MSSSRKVRALRPESVDVLVAGAGPTGLALACQLMCHGLRCRVIDAAAAPATESRALALHARTLEIFEGLGIADRVIDAGRKLYGANVYADGQRIIHVGFEDLDTPYPFVLSLPQTTTERILTERFEELGGVIERGVAFRGLTLHDDGVTATLSADGREEIAQVPWLVGCDGAHSSVRKALALGFDGAAYDETFVLADAVVASDLPSDEMHLFLSASGVCLLAPLPGERRARLVADRPTEAIAHGEQPLTLEVVRAMAHERGAERADLDRADWLTPFRIHRRLASSFRVGRAFIAGDAAHIHSPVGGQGMNTGIQDANNLAWKLALATRGVGRAALLDSYEAERRPIATATLEGTDLTTRLLTLRHPVSRELRNQAARFLASFEVIRNRAVQSAAELRINYRGSPIVAEHRAPLHQSTLFADRTQEDPSVRDWLDFGAAPRAGDRAPDVPLSTTGSEARLFELLRHPGHTLLLFDGSAPTEQGYLKLANIAAHVSARCGDRIRAHVVVPRSDRPSTLPQSLSVVLDPEGAVHHRYGAGAECLYLIRPDGYVGFRSQPAERAALDGYLELVFAP